MKENERRISAEYLRSIMDYDPESGEFHWKKAWHKGKRAGTISIFGYRVITIDFSRYRAHRLAWLYMTGEWPDQIVDHVNGVRDDDRFANLRLVTSTENSINKSVMANNKLGIKGVSYCKTRMKYCAYIKVDGKQRNLGRFDTPEEAKRAYDEAALGFGQFRRENETYRPYVNHY